MLRLFDWFFELVSVLFVMGKRYYKVKTPKTNVIVQFVKCTAVIIRGGLTISETIVSML